MPCPSSRSEQAAGKGSAITTLESPPSHVRARAHTHAHAPGDGFQAGTLHHALGVSTLASTWSYTVEA